MAGSIYQWSKRLSNKTLGWFTGWFYFWAGVLTVTAVAATVALVMSPLFGIDLAAPSPVPFLNTWSFLSVMAMLVSTIINAFGVRLLALLNNLGVAAEILGMIVLALVLLIFANNQPISVIFDTSYTADLANGNYFAVFLVGMFLALFVVYGFDTAGTFGEETVDAGRQAPRGDPGRDLAVGHRRLHLPARRSSCPSRTSTPRSPRARPSGSRSPPPSRKTSTRCCSET